MKVRTRPTARPLMFRALHSCAVFTHQVSSVKVRLSLQRAKDSFDNVYVGVKPGQMLLDLMMRMDSAHIKVS